MLCVLQVIEFYYFERTCLLGCLCAILRICTRKCLGFGLETSRDASCFAASADRNQQYSVPASECLRTMRNALSFMLRVAGSLAALLPSAGTLVKGDGELSLEQSLKKRYITSCLLTVPKSKGMVSQSASTMLMGVHLPSQPTARTDRLPDVFHRRNLKPRRAGLTTSSTSKRAF